MSTQTKPHSFGHALWQDDRSLKQRLMLVLSVTLGCSFTFILFGMLDLFFNNRNVMSFYLTEIISPVLLLWLGVFTLLSAVLMLLRGRVLNVALSLLFGLLLAGYLQGTFLNLSLGQLTGATIAWDKYRTHAVTNLLIWYALITLPFLLLAWTPKWWRRALLFVPLLLVAMQLTSLVSSLVAASAEPSTRSSYLSEDGMFELSTKDNILVFVIDRMDGSYIDDIFNQQEDYFDDLEGFTYYRDNVSVYTQTYPSIPYMLTGKPADFNLHANEYFKAYQDSALLKALREQDYTTKLYIQSGYTYTDVEQLSGVADNIRSGSVKLRTSEVIKQMSLLSACRYVPHALKATFWLPSNVMDDVLELLAGQKPYKLDDMRLYDRLLSLGLTTQSDHNNFTYIHMHGSHTPYLMDAQAKPISEDEANEIKQTMGCFHILREYFQRMKDLGVYEDATILILGDHENAENERPLDTFRTTALFVKPRGSANVPLDYSDAPTSLENFQATIALAADLDPEPFGVPFEDLAEGDPVVRTHFHRVDIWPPNRRHYLERYEIHDYAENFDNWTKIEEIDMTYPDG